MLISPRLIQSLVAAAMVAIAAPAAPALELPCPLPSSWELVRQLTLPARGVDGQRIGGFSAASYDPALDELWLLSDLPQGSITVWRGLAAVPRLQRNLPLQRDPMDGEGLVRLQGQLWVASEGRRSADRPAELLRFDDVTGALLQIVPLPPAWQPLPGQGLASNAGPESLALLGAGTGTPALLMAAERPLLQDPERHVRLLRWHWQPGQDPRAGTPVARPQGSLLLPSGDNWGLTDLLEVQPSGHLLALLRRFQFPNQWQIRLALYPLPDPTQARPAEPLASWDLVAGGLEPDNWEGLAQGPSRPGELPLLLLVSDDNLNPLQANRLAMLTPRCD
jgi:hypothetical protein